MKRDTVLVEFRYQLFNLTRNWEVANLGIILTRIPMDAWRFVDKDD